jgi:hypothetical protein
MIFSPTGMVNKVPNLKDELAKSRGKESSLRFLLER